MLKKERQSIIQQLVQQQGIITVTDLLQKVKVSDMTIRRDLQELEQEGILKRVHGGAQSTDYDTNVELSHLEKQTIFPKAKQEVAKAATSLIQPGETIFLGIGTTIELMVDYLPSDYLRIVTNSLPVFDKIKTNPNYEVYLIGGMYRERTNALVGAMASEGIRQLKFKKAFIGANGIQNQALYTANIEEGKNQKQVLDNALEKIIVVDHHKFNQADFYAFYDLNKIDYVVVDHDIDSTLVEEYETYTKIIRSPEITDEV